MHNESAYDGAASAQPRKSLYFNNLVFAELGSCAPAGLPASLHGFYRTDYKGIHLYDRDEQLEAYVVANPRQGYFVVTAHEPQPGTARYLFGASESTEKWLGLDKAGYADTERVIRAYSIE